MSLRRVVVALSLGILAFAPAARAQGRTTIAVTGGPVAFPTPTAADYDAGFILATAPLVFTVDASGGPATQRTATVAVSGTSATLGGAKPLSDLQWRRADLGAWNGLTLGGLNVEAHPMVRNGLNDPWTNSVYFRMLLSWAATPPGTYTTGITLTLTVTTP